MLASLLVLLAQQSFVLLLGLNECFLEEIGVYMVISMPTLHCGIKYIGLTVGVGEADGECLSLWFSFRDVCGGVPYPAAVAANVWRELHVRDHYKTLV